MRLRLRDDALRCLLLSGAPPSPSGSLLVALPASRPPNASPVPASALLYRSLLPSLDMPHHEKRKASEPSDPGTPAPPPNKKSKRAQKEAQDAERRARYGLNASSTTSAVLPSSRQTSSSATISRAGATAGSLRTPRYTTAVRSSTRPNAQLSSISTNLEDLGTPSSSHLLPSAPSHEADEAYTAEDVMAAEVADRMGLLAPTAQTRIVNPPAAYKVPPPVKPRHYKSRASKAESWSAQLLPRLIAAYLDRTAQMRHGITTRVLEPSCTCRTKRKLAQVTGVNEDGKSPRGSKMCNRVSNVQHLFIGIVLLKTCPCKCKPLDVRLMYAGYFPCSPKRPTLAFSINALEKMRNVWAEVAPNVTAWSEAWEKGLRDRGYKHGTRVSLLLFSVPRAVYPHTGMIYFLENVTTSNGRVCALVSIPCKPLRGRNRSGSRCRTSRLARQPANGHSD